MAFIESEGNHYGNLLAAAGLSVLLVFLFVSINMLAWGLNYQERKRDEK